MRARRYGAEISPRDEGGVAEGMGYLFHGELAYVSMNRSLMLEATLGVAIVSLLPSLP